MSVIYTSSTFSLALLEIIVNASSAGVPRDMVYAPIDIPETLRLEALDIATLPRNWADFPAPPECRRVGDDWTNRGETVGLIVPSAVARIDNNILLNPAHRDFQRLVIGTVDVMAIDRRLVR